VVMNSGGGVLLLARQRLSVPGMVTVFLGSGSCSCSAPGTAAAPSSFVGPGRCGGGGSTPPGFLATAWSSSASSCSSPAPRRQRWFSSSVLRRGGPALPPLLLLLYPFSPLCSVLVVPREKQAGRLGFGAVAAGFIGGVARTGGRGAARTPSDGGGLSARACKRVACITRPRIGFGSRARAKAVKGTARRAWVKWRRLSPRCRGAGRREWCGSG